MLLQRSVYCYRLFFAMVAAGCVIGASAQAWAQFETRAIQPMYPYGAWSIATGDFNKDGNLDVAVTVDSGFSILLGNGDGTFKAPVFHSTQLSYSLAVGDFNNDGVPDIVVTNDTLDPSTVSVYLGNGDGTFKAPIVSNTTSNSTFVVVGNFNNDKNLDIAIIDAPYISILLGNGDGTFQPPSDNDSFVIPAWLALGDFNNDGNLDVITDGSFGSNYDMGVLLGNGDGTLQNSLTYPLEYVPATIAAADLRGNGKMDAVVGYDLYDIGVFLGNGDGSFQPVRNYLTTGLSGGPIVASDLNSNGQMDLAVQAAFGSLAGVDVFWNNGDGTFENAKPFASSESGLLAVADLNNDHLPDFVMANELYVTAMLNTGVLSVSPTTAPLTFPVELINTASTYQSVELTNAGTVRLAISSIKISGPFQASNTCRGSLAVGANCTISVAFKPRAAGTFAGLVTLVDSASTKPQFIDLTGSGTAVKVSPGSLNFGSQKVGTKGAPLSVTAVNEGDKAIEIGSITIGGNDRKDFSETDDCAGRTIKSGMNCTVTVTFDPAKTGSRTAGLYFNLVTGQVAPAPANLAGMGT